MKLIILEEDKEDVREEDVEKDAEVIEYYHKFIDI